MDTFVINGGQPLMGKIRADGSKNAALPILAGTLLIAEGAYVAEASVEGEARDALSGVLLAAGVDRRAGTKFLGKASGGVSKWKDVELAFQAWAQQFKANLRKRSGR